MYDQPTTSLGLIISLMKYLESLSGKRLRLNIFTNRLFALTFYNHFRQAEKSFHKRIGEYINQTFRNYSSFIDEGVKHIRPQLVQLRFKDLDLTCMLEQSHQIFV